MGLRCFQEDDFMSRLLDSMSFQSFVADRGVPYRVCDLFDEVKNKFFRKISAKKLRLS